LCEWTEISSVFVYNHAQYNPLLAETLVMKGKSLSNPSDFAVAVDEEFSDFQFPDDFVFDIWGAVSDGRSGRL